MAKAVAAILILAGACQGSNPGPELVAGPPVTIADAELNVAVLDPAVTSTTEAPTTIPATTTSQPARRNSGIVEPSTIQSDALASIRACESHSDYTTDTGNGYYGAYQFSLTTWQSVGGSGNPANASAAEQDMRAQVMIDAGRRGEWPNC